MSTPELRADRPKAERLNAAVKLCEEAANDYGALPIEHRDALTTVLSALAEAEKDAARLDGLRKLMGYVQDGSETVVKLYQDDATQTYFVDVGRNAYFSENGFRASIDSAIAAADAADREAK